MEFVKNGTKMITWTEIIVFTCIFDIYKLSALSKFNDNYSKLALFIWVALKGTLSGSLSVTLADESWKSPFIEDKKYS